jgi:AcrR family transcriptional regulator
MHILDVAEALFSEQGYYSTSLEQVALGSEYSVGSLYTFFSGKRELLAAVLRRRQDEMAPVVEEILRSSLSGLDELLALCAASAEYLQNHAAFAKLTMRVYQAGLESIPAFTTFRQDGIEDRAFAAAVRKGQCDGTIRPGGVAWLATLIEGMLMFDQLARDNSVSGGEPIEHLLALIRRSVATDPA